MTRLLTGEGSCQCGSWFKAQHDGGEWEKTPSRFDPAPWLIRHTDLLNWRPEDYRQRGYVVTLEGQNIITLRGRAATDSGKPDLIARQSSLTPVTNTRTGGTRRSHHAPVAVYMYLLPQTRSEYQSCPITGQVVYKDQVEEIGAGSVDERFIAASGSLIQGLSAWDRAVKVRSRGQCRFCGITLADCPEGEEGPEQEVDSTEEFQGSVRLPSKVVTGSGEGT